MTSIFFSLSPKEEPVHWVFNHNRENHIHAPSLLCSASSWCLSHLTADPGRSSQVSVSHDRLKHSHKRPLSTQNPNKIPGHGHSGLGVSQPYYTEKKNFNLSSAFLHITDIQKGSIGRNQTYKSLPAFTGETSKSSFSYNMEEERCA